MSRVNAFVTSWVWLMVSVPLLLVWGALQLEPSSHWLEVRSVKVSDGPWPPIMAVDREIKRDGFRASWTAVVYRWENDGWVVACPAAGTQTYKAGAKLPAGLTLDWWTAGQCRGKLGPGQYVMTTSWVIDAGSLVTDKKVTIDSNIWSVP